MPNKKSRDIQTLSWHAIVSIYKVTKAEMLSDVHHIGNDRQVKRLFWGGFVLFKKNIKQTCKR